MKKITPAEISYTDGETKTILFPEVAQGDLKNISVDGEKIMQIHDLAKSVSKQSKQIRFMALMATALLIGAVGMAIFLTNWLVTHQSAIEIAIDRLNARPSKEIRELTSTNRTYAKKLSDEGWHWAHGTWTNRK